MATTIVVRNDNSIILTDINQILLFRDDVPPAPTDTVIQAAGGLNRRGPYILPSQRTNDDDEVLVLL